MEKFPQIICAAYSVDHACFLFGGVLIYITYGVLPPLNARERAFPLQGGRFMIAQDGKHLFTSYRHAREIIEDWRNDYNLNRPHTSLDGLTPYEFATRSREDQNMNRANL
ncbi:hypothetical protein CYG48_18390 (plasmid) [Neorhizobium sp. SOG26]|nr:hypothetical protein CYG48_18390 [Neorhizobium sp. SOG26]